MKFKYLSMALAAVALASCSSDDLKLADGTTLTLPEDGSKIFATIESDGSDLTRAGFATQIEDDGSISQTAMFQEGDEFKMYCNHTWKPQTYVFVQDAEINGVNGALFEFADEDSPYNDEADLSTREYGVFPADNFYFKDENRSKLYYKIGATTEYESDIDGYYGSQSTELTPSNGTDLSGRKVYKALVPMFGFNVDNKVTFKYMTALIRVQLQGVTGDQTHTLTLSQTEKAEGHTNKFQLSGEFGSTEFDATDGNEYGDDSVLPVFNTVETTKAEDQSVTVRFTTDGSESDYVIYLPVPTGTYDLRKLKLTYDAQDLAMKIVGDKTYAGGVIPAGGGNCTPVDSWAGAKKTAFATASKAYVLGTGTKLIAYNSEPEVATAVNLMKLNALLNKYADFDREAVVDVDITGFQNIPKQTDGTVVAANKKLMIPELKNDVTLNLMGASIGSDETNDDDKILYIVDKGAAGTGKLTINFSAEDDAAARTCVKVVSTSAQNIELKTTNGATAANTATFASASFNNAAAKVALNASFTTAPTITAASEITIKKDLGVGINAGTANLIIEDAITGVVTSNGGNVTVNAEATDVITEIHMQKPATTKLDDNADIIIKNGKVTNLTLNKDVKKLVMTGGEIATKLRGETATSYAFKDGTALTVQTSGTALIKDVADLADATKSTITFKSTWNDATANATATTAQQKIFTAYQLKSINSTPATTYTLYTDVDFDLEEKDFASLTLAATTTSFDGVNTFNKDAISTITGLDKALFASVGNTTGALTISNLKLADADITPEKVVTGFGVLANTITGSENVTIDNVVISGASLGLTGSATSTKACNYGLIAGINSNSAVVEIKDCGVSGTVSGYYNLGGYIGNQAGGTVKFTKTAANAEKNLGNVTFEKSFTSPEEEDDNAGKVGNFIGSVTAASVIVIGDDTNAPAFDNFFSADNVTADNIANAVKNGTKTYKGMAKHEIGLSPAANITFGAGAAQSKLYGKYQTADATPKAYVAGPTATNTQVVMVNIYE